MFPLLVKAFFLICVVEIYVSMSFVERHIENEFFREKENNIFISGAYIYNGRFMLSTPKSAPNAVIKLPANLLNNHLKP
jgi:hypothetical protein